ncbi:syntaxin-19-like [Aedes albopictus]|uniref:t-SNARE coiled-coil homology domain-containing protein n=1 Tax=Aedes albopictus TaxID=7160 RepID=A0ABM1ZW00_AEDAL
MREDACRPNIPQQRPLVPTAKYRPIPAMTSIPSCPGGGSRPHGSVGQSVEEESAAAKREFVESLENLPQQHEYKTLLNQKQIIQDLSQFSKISHWIGDLQQNVQAIEEELVGQGSIKASQKLGDNATLCHKIFNAVKGLQADLENLRQQKDEESIEPRESDDLVSLVRSTQFESVKTAYFEAYWRFHSLVHNYEETVRKRRPVESSHQSLTTPSQCDIAQPKNTPDYDDVDASQHPSRRHSLDEQIHLPKSTTIFVEEEGQETVTETLQAVEERHEELQALERTLVDMRDLFVLFSTLVMEHGSMLNLAETKVQDAAQHVATAAADIKEAHYYYRKVGGRKWLCFDVTCGLLVLLAFLVAIAIYLAMKKFLF